MQYRFFIRPGELRDNNIFMIFEKDVIFKARNILRLKKGDRIRLFDGEGHEFTAEIDTLRKDLLGGKVVDNPSSNVTESIIHTPELHLAQALTQSKKLELILRMGTEIGINSFRFYESDHSIVKLNKLGQDKLKRWEKISVEASRQSERIFTPKIHEPVHFIDLFELEKENVICFLSAKVNENVSSANDFFSHIRNKSLKITLVVGPEGGFSAKENAMILERKIAFVHLPLPIMRTETAGIVAASHFLISMNSDLTQE